MHREILTGGYDPAANQLSRLFDEGKFNCVSATVLFNALAADCGLTARAIELPTHAYSVVAAGDQSLIVETTCPTWFEESQQPRPTAARCRRSRNFAGRLGRGDLITIAERRPLAKTNSPKPSPRICAPCDWIQ